MATERLSMRKTREILRQKWELGRSHRAVARAVGASPGTVGEVLVRAQRAGLDWATAQQLDEDALEARLYVVLPGEAAITRPLPDCAYLHLERRKVGVTLELLHHEYLEHHPDGYRYTQFCDLYRRWVKRHRLSMRQEHRAGEKLFVDYSGKKPHYLDPQSGVPVEVELFVAVLGASNYTYAEATLTQRGPDWIASHGRALAYLGGVPGALVPDQLKSGVTAPCRYEPGIQRTYEELAQHYGTTVLPARPRRPRDKAKAEVGVLIAQRWILARLRHQTFFSLDALNERIAELLEELNARTMKIYGASRRALFEKLDAPALGPLPTQPFVYGRWHTAAVNIDYHIEYEGHYYSVPHVLRTEKPPEVELRVTATTVEVYYKNERRASHPRSYQRGRHTTTPAHMPKSHQRHAEWTPSRIIDWAGKVGPHTAALTQAIIAERPHPEQGYRSCLGILRLAQRYGEERLERACARALAVGARSYRHVASMLKCGLDSVPLAMPPESTDPQPPVEHENLRGRDYYN